MLFRLLRCALPLLIATVAAPAFAQPKVKQKEAPAPDAGIDESTIPGEVHIGTKHEFVKFTVDGKEWDNHEYVDKNKTLVVKGLERNEDRVIVMTPRESGFEPYTLTVAPTAYKKVATKKGKTKVLVFKAQFKVDFAKPAAPAEPAKDGKAK
jgi:uncharacterized GH25 family protein